MSDLEMVPARLVCALHDYADNIAIADRDVTLSYGQLAQCVERLQPHLPDSGPVAVFGKPSAYFCAAATACVISGRPFVHLDPAMPAEVLAKIMDELSVHVVLQSAPSEAAHLPAGCRLVDVACVLADPADRASGPIAAADVLETDIIYIVATSGTTGRPKCIPVTHQSAALSYNWRDAYTPYDPSHRVGTYIFALWEMFRPLRCGAQVVFPRFMELMNPAQLVEFWVRNGVTEMLFTPSALEKTLQACPTRETRNVPLRRIILNGEVVSDALVAALDEKLPHVTVWNLYSICETHDISITKLARDAGSDGAVSVGVPMPHLNAIVLDDSAQICPAGQPGLLHFEGQRMLGPGYINRAEETALRFRTQIINGRQTRLYDTGDQGYVDAQGAVHVMGRLAHMLKLRGHSIQTRELMESLHDFLGFTQAVPWIQDVGTQGATLVFYYTADASQSAANLRDWGLKPGENRMPTTLSKALRHALPLYCIPGYLVQLDAIPINAVSGKCDFKRLPAIAHIPAVSVHDGSAVPTLSLSAECLGCAASDLDAALSFHDQGGDSLMAVNLLMALEEAYGCRVDFDFALNVPLGRLHEILSEQVTPPPATARFTARGILLTGATGFLGSRVMAEAARNLAPDEVVYCVVRTRRKDPTERLLAVAAAAGVASGKLVLIPASIEDTRFGLDAQSYHGLTSCVTSVIHCAAMVNLAVDPAHMKVWAQAGISNIVQFCRDAGADMRFSSSSAVFPDTGGPHIEDATVLFENCSGYGAAKIAAEQQIMDAGIPAALVRLPSLYDLDAPNGKDIYEIILAACNRMNAVPEGFAFRMIEVQAAAEFLVNLCPAQDARFFNLTPECYVSTTLMPTGVDILPVEDWLRDAPLSEAERALISSDISVLRATSRFDHHAARAMWEKVMSRPFDTICDPAALVARRITG